MTDEHRKIDRPNNQGRRLPDGKQNRIAHDRGQWSEEVARHGQATPGESGADPTAGGTGFGLPTPESGGDAQE
ncbi:MAG TPA: hypothetical protein PKA20_08520 [Burkholderiaceae bacterium]|nr:hypothetical protein [Burkholderiaceae bacterium]